MNSMTPRAERKQKIVLQSIAFIILGVAFVGLWHELKDARATGGQPASEAILLSALSSLFNNLYVVLSMSFLAILFGIACAFYLEEWLPATNWIRRLIESLVAILTGIPSIVYGILAILIFFSYADTLKEAIEAFPLSENIEAIPSQIETTVFYAEALTFILMVMPLTIKTTQEALRSVATPIREAAYVLGASQWQVLTRQVVPIAFTRILAGGCRSMSRAFAMAALLVGIYTWHYTTEPGGMSGSFILFLGVALFLSIFSSTLIWVYGSDSAQHS
ncbi:MAG: ABC transporter permease subunit [Candidatus Poribacteria bacterium]|nr:ABC transporter permease subunit [Candidatus Poribacteria bacterium]